MGFPNDSGNPGFFPLFLQVTCNCFTISNGEMQDVGVGLYPSMSLLNHSCDPNCVIVFEGYQLLLRSVREIQIGEELTISYIESLVPTSERQKQLMRQYCFECDCLLCQNQEKDAEKLAGEEHAWKEVKDAVNEVRYPKSKEEWEQILARCQNLLSSNTGRLPDTNIYQLKMLDCAMDACINLESWEEALYYGSRTLGPYRLYYPGFHPLRAVQLMRVGKLQYSQDMFPQALETLKQAYNIMKVTHGADHSLMQALMEIKEQCEAVLYRAYALYRTVIIMPLLDSDVPHHANRNAGLLEKEKEEKIKTIIKWFIISKSRRDENTPSEELRKESLDISLLPCLSVKYF
ncbi:hypothetical protein llap_1675 [Limosa lapponica baueri]|uniref:[histone H3]-lysine(4) N-trimethyltransferase n=1 Tax=Limosa lapponica baueri TaxID=1758121 RepID=A0A2I0UPS4_LIMLA|nr:hypothetical protein llap_1675 [Limosa lapponica baueri]